MNDLNYMFPGAVLADLKGTAWNSSFKELSQISDTNSVFFMEKRRNPIISYSEHFMVLGVAPVVWNCWKLSKQCIRASHNR